MENINALAIAIVAAPLIVQLIKALKAPVSDDLLPFVAGAFGFVIVLIAGYLMHEDIDRDLIVVAIIGAFGPSGFYEVVLKRVPVVGQP